jgi:S1-C subfamily serine protease
MGFFIGPDEKVYGRYGGRDAKSAEGRLSLAGLRFALEQTLVTHRRQSKSTPQPTRKDKPLLAEEYPAARNLRRGECIHCHQISEFRRHQAKLSGTFQREELWVYPLPENVGLLLDNDQGNKVRSLTAGSPADKAGIRGGDLLQAMNGVPIHSSGDVQFALHRAPASGKIAIQWSQEGKAITADLELAPGWRKTNWTWRPSMLDILPSLSLYGEDLTVGEKKTLGLSDKRLAFRQDKTVHKDARKLGVEGGDVIIGIDDLLLELTMLDFLAHIRRNYLVGDRIKLNIIRNGKRLDLPGQL